jgi:hypothetical protein
MDEYLSHECTYPLMVVGEKEGRGSYARYPLCDPIDSKDLRERELRERGSR